MTEFYFLGQLSLYISDAEDEATCEHHLSEVYWLLTLSKVNLG